MKNLSVSKKLICGFGLVLVMLMFIVWLTISALSNINGIVEDFYYHNVQSIIKIDNANAKIQEMAKNLLHAAGYNDDEQDLMQTYLDKAEACYAEANSYIEALNEVYV